MPESEEQLRRFKLEVMKAERFGHAPRWLVDQAGTIASYLERDGQTADVVADARAWARRALSLPVETIDDD